ncbi:MAG: hypothetical protein PHF56_00275 [Desulfuromonadaceae bacterium]|nr:hypothetical protein [Desulfuromonadaceae bacterium]
MEMLINMAHSKYPLLVQDHDKDIRQIINNHFDIAEERIEEVYSQHFSDTKTVFNRHWRHKKDIPYDLVSPFKYAYDFVAKKIVPNKKIYEFPRSGKSQEMEQIFSEQLLDLPGLEREIHTYVNPYKELFEKDLSYILESVPALQREDFSEKLKLQIDRLQTPIDGAREAALFLVAGVVGKVFSGNFGGSIAAGSAVGQTIYLSQLSWFGSLWANIFGAPAWVGLVGGGVGFLAMLILAPVLTPLFELGINRMRAKKILKLSVNSAREKLTGNGADAFDVAGKTAIYLQFLPDILDAARKLAGIIR